MARQQSSSRKEVAGRLRSEADVARDAFHERMHAHHMYGLWELASQMTPQPQPKMIPYMWPWAELSSIIDESSQAVPVTACLWPACTISPSTCRCGSL